MCGPRWPRSVVTEAWPRYPMCGPRWPRCAVTEVPGVSEVYRDRGVVRSVRGVRGVSRPRCVMMCGGRRVPWPTGAVTGAATGAALGGCRARGVSRSGVSCLGSMGRVRGVRWGSPHTSATLATPRSQHTSDTLSTPRSRHASDPPPPPPAPPASSSPPSPPPPPAGPWGCLAPPCAPPPSGGGTSGDRRHWRAIA